MTRATLIVNPHASRVDEARLAAVVSRLGDVEVLRTQGRGHAMELAGAVGPGTIWVLGGDGTFNEVLNGAHPEAELGVVPGGRTNVLARALGPGARRRISVGRVNGRRFAFAAGVGFDAELLRRAGRGRSDLAMVATAARILREQRGRLEPALGIAGVGEAALALVANGDPYTYFGPLPLRVARGTRFEEGLALVAPERIAPRDYPRVVRYLATGRGQGFLRGRDLDRIEVSCRAPMPLQIDGEDLGDVTEAVFEVERDAVTVFVG